MDVRRIKVGAKRYRLKPLTKEQKILLTNNHYIANEWLFVSESDSYLRIAKKDSLEGNPKIKILYK